MDSVNGAACSAEPTENYQLNLQLPLTLKTLDQAWNTAEGLWERTGIPQEDLEEVVRERDVGYFASPSSTPTRTKISW